MIKRKKDMGNKYKINFPDESRENLPIDPLTGQREEIYIKTIEKNLDDE